MIVCVSVCVCNCESRCLCTGIQVIVRKIKGKREKRRDSAHVCPTLESSSRLGLLSGVYRESDQRDYNYTGTA